MNEENDTKHIIEQTAAKLAKQFASREEIRQIAEDAAPAEGLPFWNKLVSAIKAGTTYLTGGLVEFVAGNNISLTPSKNPNKIKIDNTYVAPPLPPMVNSLNELTGNVTVSAGTGLGSDKDVANKTLTLKNVGVTSIDAVTGAIKINETPQTGITITPNAQTHAIKIENTGVTSMNGLVGETLVKPGAGILVTTGTENDVKISFNPFIGDSSTPKFFVTNIVKNGEYIQLWGCWADEEDPGNIGYVEIGPFATGGTSGVTSLNGLAGTVGIVAGTANVTIGSSGNNITIGVTAGGTTGYSTPTNEPLPVVTSVVWNATTGKLEISGCHLTIVNGLITFRENFASPATIQAASCDT